MKKAVFLALIIGIMVPLYAAALEQWSAAGVEFNIRFFDRRIYYVEGDPIYIQVTITNNSPSTYRFKLADERAFSLDFDVRTASNRLLEPADILIRKRTQSQQIFFREIAVEAGESFSFVEDLRHYINITEPGSLVVQARLYPELFRPGLLRTASLNSGSVPSSAAVSSAGILESKRLNLSLRPASITGPDGIPIEMDTATGAQLVRERLAPDQVVEYTITARQKSQWEKFFLYLDLEAMMSQDAVRQRQWLNEREEGRRRMIEQFRQELQSPTADGTISVVPTTFIIERTQYNNLEGTVVVLKRFTHNNFTEKKRYTYYVRLQDNIWTIVGYSVVNLGTE